MWNEDWTKDGLCRNQAPDQLFVRGAAQNRAKQLCQGCPVRTECLAEALDNRIEWGVWGGLTERERRALLKRRPTVRSWRALLEAAREEHAATVAAQAPTPVASSAAYAAASPECAVEFAASPVAAAATGDEGRLSA